MNREWVVWYERSWVDVWTCEDRDDAFSTAYFLEEDSENSWETTLIGIETPGGEFLDMAEYYSAKPEIKRIRNERDSAEDAAEAARPIYRISVTGPEGHDFVEFWSDVYVDKYREKALAQWGADRVAVEQVEKDEHRS